MIKPKNKTKLLFIKLVVAFGIIGTDCYSQVNHHEDQVVKWSNIDVLSPKDFQGEKDTLVYNNLFNAVSSIKFEFVKLENCRYSFCQAYFDKTDSWFEGDSDLLLYHEKIHFALGELYMRKINRSIDSLCKANTLNDTYYTDIINSMLDSCSVMNDQFDRKTAHGRFEKINKDWGISTFENIKKLNAYQFDSIQSKYE